MQNAALTYNGWMNTTEIAMCTSETAKTGQVLRRLPAKAGSAGVAGMAACLIRQGMVAYGR